jgi:hypothetical protein
MTRRRVHQGLAFVWVLLLVPAWLWWQESILFVIVASIYANAVGEWSAAEAADDRVVLREIRHLKQEINMLKRDVGEQGVAGR